MGNAYWEYRDGYLVFIPQVGGWVKLVRRNTVINGNIVGLTETHIEVEGIPPLPLNEWGMIMVKPPPHLVPRMREGANDGSHGKTA